MSQALPCPTACPPPRLHTSLCLSLQPIGAVPAKNSLNPLSKQEPPCIILNLSDQISAHELSKSNLTLLHFFARIQT